MPGYLTHVRRGHRGIVIESDRINATSLMVTRDIRHAVRNTIQHGTSLLADFL